MNIQDKNKSDLSFNEATFYLVLSSYYDYLETITNFLESEREKQNQSFTEMIETREEIEGEIVEIDNAIFLDDVEQAQVDVDLEHYSYRLANVVEFENTIFSSFFVTIYFYLESELTRYCRDLEKKHQEKLSLSDIVGNGVQRAITYLVKVQHIDFSLGNSKEWEKIQNYNVLRNCIVHNQGMLDESFDKNQREKLLKFIQRPNSNLQVKYKLCILNKDFCLESLDTIKLFLHSILFATVKTP